MPIVESSWDSGILLTSLVLLALALLLLACAAARRWGSLYRQPGRAALSCLTLDLVPHILGAVRNFCCPCRPHPEDADPSHARAVELVNTYITRHAMRVWLISTVVMSLNQLVVVTNILRGTPRWYSRVQDVVVCLLMVSAMTLIAFPSCSRGRCLYLVYAGGSLGSLAFSAGSTSWQGYWYIRQSTMVARFALASASPNMGQVLLWNLLHVCVMTIRGSLYGMDDEMRGQSLFGLLLQEAFEALMVLLVADATLALFKARARHEVRELSLKGESGAMLSLLNLVCDVVVELDAGLRIVEHVPRFAAMLALPGFKSTQGAMLEEFLPSGEDRVALHRNLCPCEGDAHLATNALHVHLRDGMGGLIKAEIFHVQFTGLDGSRRHFAGIREFSEQSLPELHDFGSRARGAGRERERGRGHGEVARGTSPMGVSGLFPQVAAEPGQAESVFSMSDTDDQLEDSFGSLGGLSETGRSGAQLAPLAPTTELGKDITIMASMTQWFLPPEPGHCCNFHAAVLHLRACVDRFDSYGCNTGFAHRGRSQCPHCGVLSFRPAASGKCATCGQRAPRNAGTPHRPLCAL